jgi:hypothetical protein
MFNTIRQPRNIPLAHAFKLLLGWMYVRAVNPAALVGLALLRAAQAGLVELAASVFPAWQDP